SARDEMFKVLGLLADRLWMPYQAALEYQKNRLPVIAEQKKRFDDVRSSLSSLLSKVRTDFDKRHALIDSTNFIKQISDSVDIYRKELDDLEKKQTNVHEDDPLRDHIDILLEKKIGDPIAQKELDDIYEQGEKRYSNKIPPGYLDDKKAQVYFYDG